MKIYNELTVSEDEGLWCWASYFLTITNAAIVRVDIEHDWATDMLIPVMK
jgi:hypothetical protein